MPTVDVQNVVYSGANLRKLRLSKKLNLKTLSKISGVSVAAISYYENDIKEPTVTALRKLAKALEVKFILE